MKVELNTRPVTTVSSGSCMAIALAQEVADHDMADVDASLKTITAFIKRGSHRTGHLDFGEQFGHYV